MPKPDHDGQNVAGIRPMEIRAPIGTNAGWNSVRRPRDSEPVRPERLVLSVADHRGRAQSQGDPRKSLQERYGDHDGYVKAVKKATDALVKERFLLAEDARRYVIEAEASRVLRR